MRCLITNEPWEGPGPYSPEGLRRLDRRLEKLAPLPYTRAQLIEEAAAHAVKISIQGMQPKVSTVLRVNQGRMEIVDSASVRSCSRNRFTAGMGRSSAGGRGAVALVGDLVSAQGDKWIHPGSVVSGRPAGHQGGQTNGACGQQ